jgi:iron complex transport system substrate-binding protein
MRKHISSIFAVFVFALVLAGNASGAGKPYSRVIAMAPSITEVIFALGCGNKIAGISDFCLYPPEAASLPKVGGFVDPNLERMSALRPDLVIVQGQSEKVDAFCKRQGIRILHLNMESIPTIFAGINEIGRALDCGDRARKLCSDIRKELQAAKQLAGTNNRPRVFICISRSPGAVNGLITAGGGSFVSQILSIAGGENIFEDIVTTYPEVSKETLLRRAPDFIFEMRSGENLSPEQKERIRGEWKVLNVPAVQNNRVIVVTEDFVLLPGPRVGLATKLLARILQEER